MVGGRDWWRPPIATTIIKRRSAGLTRYGSAMSRQSSLADDREIYPKSQEALTDELIAAQAALRKELGIEVVEVEVVGPIESKKVFAPPTVVHPVVATALRGGVKITACRHQAA